MEQERAWNDLYNEGNLERAFHRLFAEEGWLYYRSEKSDACGSDMGDRKIFRVTSLEIRMLSRMLKEEEMIILTRSEYVKLMRQLFGCRIHELYQVTEELDRLELVTGGE